ncbi:MAG: hypothetical protein KGM17_05445 [Sphingomonadales bacterium]|nr:hypothetical protein [Sphingomonadales bacterium]
MSEFTPARQVLFCEALAATGNVRLTCARTGVSAETAYRLRRRLPAFAAAWDGALVLSREVAEAELADRALNGVEEAVFHRGEQVGTRLRHDSRLLLAHLARLDERADAPLAVHHAARFDELLALLGGAVPAIPMFFDSIAEENAARELSGSASPHLPEPRAIHVTRDRRQAERARAEWDAWQAAAHATVDGLLAGAPQSAP